MRGTGRHRHRSAVEPLQLPRGEEEGGWINRKPLSSIMAGQLVSYDVELLCIFHAWRARAEPRGGSARLQEINFDPASLLNLPRALLDRGVKRRCACNLQTLRWRAHATAPPVKVAVWRRLWPVCKYPFVVTLWAKRAEF